MREISLSEFVKSSLVEIAKGIQAANVELKDPDKQRWEPFCLRFNQGDSSKIPGIRFDVAVTATAQSSEKAGFMVALVNIGGGAQTAKAQGNEIVQHMQFEVGIENKWA